MTTYTLTFLAPEATPPSENEARRMSFGGRGGAIGFHKRLEKWKEAAFYAWKEQRSGEAGGALGKRCELTIDIGFYAKRTRDPHNYVGTVCKSMIDGLVLAGLWPDDNPEWVSLKEPMLTIYPKVPKSQMLPVSIIINTKENGDAH